MWALVARGLKLISGDTSYKFSPALIPDGKVVARGLRILPFLAVFCRAMLLIFRVISRRRSTHNPYVSGSSPLAATNQINNFGGNLGFGLFAWLRGHAFGLARLICLS
jgi:hypothetical protein